MFVIEELKHNKTVQVDIPKPSQLFSRGGIRKGSSYSGEVFLADGSKIDTAGRVMADAAQIAKETPDAELGIKPEKPE